MSQERSGLLARGILLSFSFHAGNQDSGIESNPTLLPISPVIVKNLPEKVLGRCSQVAKAADCKSATVGSTPTSASFVIETEGSW